MDKNFHISQIFAKKGIELCVNVFFLFFVCKYLWKFLYLGRNHKG